MFTAAATPSDWRWSVTSGSALSAALRLGLGLGLGSALS